jgi:tetratricopeptide (TPR) repeat protein
MRQTLMAFVILAAASPVYAGLYVPGEEPELVARDGKAIEMPFDQFRLRLAELKAIPVTPPDSPLRKAYLKRRADLESRRLERLSVQEMISLGECQVRLGDLNNSFFTYHLAVTREPRNFLAQSGLAAVRQMRGELREAYEAQIEALMLRPSELPGMTKAQTAWMLRVEKVFGELQRGRIKELLEKTPLQQLSVDNLFRVQFVGPSGGYEAGTIAPDEKAKLPADAVAVVQQLILWYPFDARIYWLLGELYNANGQMREALAIFKECMDRGFRPEPLKEHPLIVEEKLKQIAAADKQKQIEEEEKQFSKHPEILWAVGGIGGIAILLLVLWQVRIFWRRAATGGKQMPKR